jgi:uncharacterized protein YggE
MNTKLTLMPFVLLVAALVVLAVACGSSGSAEVRVEKGLAALAGSGAMTTSQEEATGTGASLPAGTPTPVPYAAGYSGAVYPPGGMAAVRADEALGLASSPWGVTSMPLLQGSAAGITVQGYGSATVPADTARVQFSVGKSGDVYPEPLPADTRAVPEGGVESETAPSTPPEIDVTPSPPTPMTEADLQPLVDAIKAQGVSDADIEIFIYPVDSYYSYYGPGSALVTVTLSNPSDRVGSLVNAGTQAVNDSGTLYLQNVSVLYTVDDCSALLGEARRAAVEDGRDNGGGLAQALGVKLGGVVAAAEYAYSPFGVSPCDPAFDTYYPQPYGYEGIGYDPAMPAEVQIVVNVTLTFAIG